MNKSVELHLLAINNLIPKTDTNESWEIGQVVYHLAQIANIQEHRITTLEEELKEA